MEGGRIEGVDHGPYFVALGPCSDHCPLSEVNTVTLAATSFALEPHLKCLNAVPISTTSYFSSFHSSSKFVQTPIATAQLQPPSTMAEPPAAKRQKVSKPIVFSTPGYQPDVRLVVFDQEFHVHSILLKLHSAYFRKFLDSPDKAPKVTNAVSAGATEGIGSTTADSSRISLKGPQGSYKYHWVSKIDGDDRSSWYLTAAKSDASHRRLFDELLLMTRT